MERQISSATKEPKGHGEKYHRKSMEALGALLTEQTIGVAARKVGINEKTLRTWMQKPAFRQMYRDEQRHRMDRAIAGMDPAVATVTERLLEIINNQKGCYTQDRLKAAQILFNAFFKNMQLRLQFDERLGGKTNGDADEEGSAYDPEESWEALEDESTEDVPDEIPASRTSHTVSSPHEVNLATEFSEPVGQGGEAQQPEKDGAVGRTGDGEPERKKVVSENATRNATLDPPVPQMPADARKIDTSIVDTQGTDENGRTDGDCSPSIPGSASTSVHGTGEGVAASAPDVLKALMSLGAKKKNGTGFDGLFSAAGTRRRKLKV